MASTEVVDLRAMPDEQLRGELEESLRALFNVRFQAATRQLADVSQVRGARRRVARIKTLLREREILVAYGELVEAGAPPAATDDEPEAEAEPEDEADDEDEAADEDEADDEDEAADEDEAGDDEAVAGEDETPDGENEDETPDGEDEDDAELDDESDGADDEDRE